uniref:phospholipase A and acyltransferase 4-like n=1 Tax=Epinephelus lanceolatus TaxID=310571 RepID=UPI00144620B2|nr:phospholipase A and acyltransferase 4-like [Epinephelus lanceolatus]
MKHLILVALILQLLITVIDSTGEFKFGDMVAFYRKCAGKEDVYKHYAIYVGPNNKNNVGQGDNDIFHLTGHIGPVSQYKFGKFEEAKGSSTKVEVENYFDTTDGIKPANIDEHVAEIMKRIKDSKGNCQLYGPLNKNCEHFATWVRYGKPTAKQEGTFVEPIFTANEAVKKKMAEISHEHVMELNCHFTN